MIEQDPIAGKQAIGLAVVYGLPVGVDFGTSVGAARVKGRRFLLRDFYHFPKHLQRACLEETNLSSRSVLIIAGCLPQSKGSHTNRTNSVFWGIKTHSYMLLGTQVVNLNGLNLFEDTAQGCSISQVTVV